MAKYDLKFKSNDAGTQKARTLTLSNVNPNASAQTLKSFTQKLNALTTNTYVETDLVVTTNLDTETPPIDTRQEATFSFNSAINISTGSGVGQTAYTTNSDGELSVAVNGNHNVMVGFQSGSQYLDAVAFNTPTSGTITVRISGTETYKPFEQTFEYTV